MGKIYQALYRKYRPRTFDDVCGQEHITETLKKQVETDRLSHAYLFIGTRGTGKTTCAKILAKAVNCEHPVNGNPCNACAACLGIDDGSVMDVVEIDAASNNSVDNVRALRDEAVFSPAEVKKRVYIIDEVHMLSTAAFNALLKILEEPPEHLMFILATTELRKVPATILSRCQRYSFRRLDGSVVSSRLEYVAGKEALRLTPEASELLGRLADGSLRDGLSLLDQCSGAEIIDVDAVLSAMGLAGSRRTAALLEAIADRDSQRALELFLGLWQDGKDPAGLLSELCSLMRDILVLAVAPTGGGQLLSGAYDSETLRGFSGRFTKAELLRLMERIQGSLATIKDNPSPRTAAELCLVSLCDPTLCDGIPELLARISRLEENGTTVRAVPAASPVPSSPEPEAPEEEEAPSIPEEPVWEASPPPPEPDDPPWEAPPAAERFEPEPAPEPIPEPTPNYGKLEEPEPAFVKDEVPAAPAAASAASGGTDWTSIVRAAQGRIPAGLQNMLDNPLFITGTLLDDVLTISIADGFASNMLNKPDVLDILRDAASALTGRPVSVRADSAEAAMEAAVRDLDELKRFKQTKFI